jgi:hypothetical protein
MKWRIIFLLSLLSASSVGQSCDDCIGGIVATDTRTCSVSNFYNIAYSLHDPGLRHQQLLVWLKTNGDKCDSKQLVLIWNRLAEWAGASDSAELRGRVLYYFSRAEERERKEKS